mmetsp:Transcript_83985/g.216186  ORF Transcript_83985/g.216186 Transcript_83985/m.216186 type:complete len:207 (+) Transcript_83985:1192-1812(+)
MDREAVDDLGLRGHRLPIADLRDVAARAGQLPEEELAVLRGPLHVLVGRLRFVQPADEGWRRLVAQLPLGLRRRAAVGGLVGQVAVAGVAHDVHQAPLVRGAARRGAQDPVRAALRVDRRVEEGPRLLDDLGAVRLQDRRAIGQLAGRRRTGQGALVDAPLARHEVLRGRAAVVGRLDGGALRGSQVRLPHGELRAQPWRGATRRP